jgi:hypothetical protein
MSDQGQIQNQKQAQLQFLDNGIHRLIISLERLECFLAIENNRKQPFTVAVNTDRDLHDDKSNPPTKQGFYTEVHLHILNISKQGRFTGYMEGSKKLAFENTEQIIDISASYFLNDMLEWYSSRAGEEPNDIERFAVPIIAAIADKKLVAGDIGEIIFDYVGDLDDDLSTKSEDYKREAVEKGFGAWMQAQTKVAEAMKKFEESGMNVQLTSHNRGDAKTGYLYLKNAFGSLFPDDKGKIAVLLLEKHVKRLCPKLYASIEEEQNGKINNEQENKLNNSKEE